MKTQPKVFSQVWVGCLGLLFAGCALLGNESDFRIARRPNLFPMPDTPEERPTPFRCFEEKNRLFPRNMDVEKLFRHASWLHKKSLMEGREPVLFAQAERFYRIAIAWGHEEAAWAWVLFLMEERPDSSEAAHEALETVAELIRRNSPKGYALMAYMLKKGYGVEKNPEAAQKYFWKAATMGHPAAQHEVSTARSGFFDFAYELSEVERKEMRRCAAAQGHAEAAYGEALRVREEDNKKGEMEWLQQWNSPPPLPSEERIQEMALAKGLQPETGLEAFTPLEKQPAFTCTFEKKRIAAHNLEADMLFQNAAWHHKKNLLRKSKMAFAKVERLYRIAAAWGHDEATWQLAHLLMEGKTTSPDSATHAVDMAEALVARNIPRGYTLMGHLLDKGHGVKKDANASLRYFLKAADLGNPEAQHFLGDKLTALGANASKTGLEMKRCAEKQGHVAFVADTEKKESPPLPSEKRIREMARQKGLDFRTGRPAQENALSQTPGTWEKQLPFACIHEAEYLPKRDAQADKLFEYAQKLHKKTPHEKEKNPEAFAPTERLYRIAAAWGHDEAAHRLAHWLMGNTSNPDSIAEAVDMARELIRRKIPSGYYLMGLMLHDAHGVEEDSQAALQHFRMAADLGNPEAQTLLGEWISHWLLEPSVDLYEMGEEMLRCALEQEYDAVKKANATVSLPPPSEKHIEEMARKKGLNPQTGRRLKKGVK